MLAGQDDSSGQQGLFVRGDRRGRAYVAVGSRLTYQAQSMQRQSGAAIRRAEGCQLPWLLQDLHRVDGSAWEPWWP